MAAGNDGRTSHGDLGEIDGIHHVEIYVSNNYQAAHFYRTVLGFEAIGALVSEGADRSSIVLQRGEARLLLTAPSSASTEVARHIFEHGEGIKDIALSARDVDRCFARALNAGARAVLRPITRHAGDTTFRIAGIASCGDLVHSLVWRSRCDGPTLPGLLPALDRTPPPETALDGIDHIALALNEGELDRCVDFYVSAFGFRRTHHEDVSTDDSAMRSTVVTSANGAVRLPLMEPARGRRRSQIEDYVRCHAGPGAQHLAFRSRDIVKSVSTLMPGIEFLPIPPSYYDSLEARVGPCGSELEALRRCGILVDRDASGLLLQVFTKPIGSRPTLFLEVIERRGGEGFGSGNIKALFQAVERTQAARGGL